MTFPPLLEAWFLTGPTASGKSKIGLELAERLGAEVVSLDSMAVYRGMDLGTAKPTRAERDRLPHHLVDVVDPDQDYSLSEYVAAAHETCRSIRERGKPTLFVGGTPLYLKALLRGLYPGPPADWTFRQQIEAELAECGVEALHQRLQLLDPLSAARLHPHDKRRIIRALEVLRQTGEPLSHRQMQFDQGTPADRCRVFVLSWDRHALHQRIAERVDRMFERGLVAEVEHLLQQYQMLSRTALQAVGYREVIEHLRGERNVATTVDLVKQRTRQFARRQETWFRSLCECRPMKVDDSTPVEKLVEAMLSAGSTAAI